MARLCGTGSLDVVPKSTRKRISARDARYGQRTSDALRFLAAPFVVLFFCGRDGLTSPGPNTSPGRSQLEINVLKIVAELTNARRGVFTFGYE